MALRRDVTYITTTEGWLYLATVLDVYTHRVVGWAMDKHMDAELVERALQMGASHRRPDAGVLHHSDRGSQYASRDYQQLLGAHKMVVSMSRKGDCYPTLRQRHDGELLLDTQERVRRWRVRFEGRSSSLHLRVH